MPLHPNTTYNKDNHEIDDEQKVRELCGSAHVEIFKIFEKLHEVYDLLEEIRDMASLIKLPQLSSYKKIVIEKEEEEVEEVTELQKAPEKFKPATKQNKGNPLSELLHNMSEADKAKLIGSLETNLKKD